MPSNYVRHFLWDVTKKSHLMGGFFYNPIARFYLIDAL